MPKTVHDDVLDGALNIIKNNCTRMTACGTEPTTYDEAITTYKLADATMSGTDFTNADAAGGGRKSTVAAKNGETIDTGGTANWITLVDVTNTKLLYKTTCTPLVLTAGQTVNFGTWNITIGDPT